MEKRRNSVRLSLYHRLVNRNESIRRSYHRLRSEKSGLIWRFAAWAALLVWNIEAAFFPRRYHNREESPDTFKQIASERSESELAFRESPREFAQKLDCFDIISFDVFDTLIFRVYDQPSALFYLVGEALNYPDFKRIRVEAEERVRREKEKKEGTAEITLSEIYSYLEQYAGISAEAGMKAEIEAEESCCFGNPYMLAVFSELHKRKKTIIAISDMYLPESVISKLTAAAGYTGICRSFISCEWKAGKSDGKLFDLVKTKLGQEKRYCHIGDNRVSDFDQAGKHGFHPFYYPNCNDSGRQYRTEEMSVICGSMYRGLVNSQIRNGLFTFSREYELGFVYGGLFVMGYCRFIHDYAKQNQIEKLLFLSRDGEILYQAYHKLYPEEKANNKSDYVYWSRMVSVQLSSDYYRYDFFRRFLMHKVNSGDTLAEVFCSMGLNELLLQYLESENNKRREEDRLTANDADKIKAFLIREWKQVQTLYQQRSEAAELYYKQILTDCKKAAAIDVGWAGSGALSLRRLVSDVWKIDCEITGIIAGTNTVHNAEPDMSDSFLFSGELVSYLYSPDHNRDLWKWHNPAKGHNLGIELLLSSASGSFAGFELDPAGNILLKFKKPDVNPEAANEIQKGILAFISIAAPAWKLWKNEGSISGADAYAPLRFLMEKDKNLIRYAEENITVSI